MKKLSIGILSVVIAVGLSSCGSPKIVPDDDAPVVSSPYQEGSSAQASESSSADKTQSGASTVYFTSDISSDGMMKIYQALGWTPTGKVAVKLSTGEPPASNYLRPELIKDLVQSVDGTIVECNTAYGGSRSETEMHKQVAKRP